MSKEYDELLAAAKALVSHLDDRIFYALKMDRAAPEFRGLSELATAIDACEAAAKQPWDGRERRKEDALGFDADSDWRKP